MTAGLLDRRVQFYRATMVDDGFSSTEVFAVHGQPVSASKAEISDGERWKAGEVAAQITSRFRIRYSAFAAALTPNDRLICEGRAYDIVGLKEIGRREAFEITAAARND